MKKVFIDTEFIKLDSLLKFAEIVDSGGFAKLLITEGYVKVNGIVCEQRGKKIVHDDLIEVSLVYDDGSEDIKKIKVLKRG